MPPRARARSSTLADLADARLLADALTQVVQLRAVDVTDGLDVDLVDLRRVERERPLDPDTRGLLANGERLADARPLALDHDPLEHLDPLPCALDHLEVDADGVSRLEDGDIRAQLALLEALDDGAHGGGRKPTWNASGTARGPCSGLRSQGRSLASSSWLQS